MTCIIGLQHGSNVYIGGDSRGVAGLSVAQRLDEKVFHNGPFLIGFTSSFRMGQILRYKFDPPKQTAKQDDMAYMVSDFIDAVRKCFRVNGYSWDDEGDHGGTFLIGYNKRLYKIGSDYQVGIPGAGYDSCGCGHDLAMGAMYALSKSKIAPEARIKLSLEAAAKFNAGVAAPFMVLKV